MIPPDWWSRYQHWRRTPPDAWSRRRTFWYWTTIAIIIPVTTTISFTLWIADALPWNQ